MGLNQYIRYGLRLPNGTVAWDTYRGHPLDTPEHRAVMVEVLRKTASDLDFDELAFLSHYGWVRRVENVVPGVVPVDHPKALQGDGSGDTDGDEVPGSGHVGAVHQGSVGGPA